MSVNPRSYIPGFVKPILRLLKYRNERKKFLREIEIRKQQDALLKRAYNDACDQLILFLVLGADWHTGTDEISGGIISIVSVCEETSALKSVHNAETIMCTMNNAHLLLKHEKFDNDTFVYRFSQIKKYFRQLSSVVIHVPEMLTEIFLDGLSAGDKQWMAGIRSVHINVMNQNIRLMPVPAVFRRLQQLAGKVTITTAHSKYCNQYYRDLYGVPIHKLSVWISPEQYQFVQWEDKENLIVVSPDKHPMKEEILNILSAIPGLTVQIIQNLTYQEYKSLVSRAKWTITFGEGLDGYFIEPVFSGAIAFAVYNDEFFTPDFQSLPTLFESFETLREQIVTKLQALDNATTFEAYQLTQFQLCAKYYSKEQYKNNLIEFYKGNYTYA